jgi:membrane protease YdiL (CAAX protease family)
MSREWEPWLAVAAASLLFGLLHAITITYIFLAAMLGAYLGVLYLVTANLLSVILAHAFYDFLALIYLVHSPAAQAEGKPPPVAANDSQK